MTAGLVGLVVGILGLGGLALHLWAIIDVVRTPAPVWARANQNQIVWALVVLLFSLLGPILYLVIARPALQAAGGDSIA
ncbi:MAG: PLDc N-terminal domain-containing protein [Acidimicrobiia bacterium]|nr:PLDc N-terminal domain-containing protein [Acidimicrobiia bacterium]